MHADDVRVERRCFVQVRNLAGGDAKREEDELSEGDKVANVGTGDGVDGLKQCTAGLAEIDGGRTDIQQKIRSYTDIQCRLRLLVGSCILLPQRFDLIFLF
jgi:hypothetical protein